MHHLLAAQGSVAQNAVLANIPVLTDQYFSVFNNGYVLGTAQMPLKAYTRAPDATVVQLNTPKLRNIGPPQLWPFDTAADPPNLPPMVHWDGSAPVIQGLDAINVQVSRAGAGADFCTSLLWMADRPQEKVNMSCRTVPFTAAITRVANQWIPGTITFGQTLPVGRYAVIGMGIFGTGLLAGRLSFATGGAKPGVLAQQAVGEYDAGLFRYGNFGEFGRFHSTNVPTLEIIGYGANTAQTGFLDLVPLDGQG